MNLLEAYNLVAANMNILRRQKNKLKYGHIEPSCKYTLVKSLSAGVYSFTVNILYIIYPLHATKKNKNKTNQRRCDDRDGVSRRCPTVSFELIRLKSNPETLKNLGLAQLRKNIKNPYYFAVMGLFHKIKNLFLLDIKRTF